mmetsp:Transcript_8347/g.23746  ORF Transcript_8347/g.23746 Transcript_8347/m.23746 type:complete len:107 (-) Transcript_8347:202-522(-)
MDGWNDMDVICWHDRVYFWGVYISVQSRAATIQFMCAGGCACVDAVERRGDRHAWLSVPKSGRTGRLHCIKGACISSVVAFSPLPPDPPPETHSAVRGMVALSIER